MDREWGMTRAYDSGDTLAQSGISGEGPWLATGNMVGSKWEDPASTKLFLQPQENTELLVILVGISGG